MSWQNIAYRGIPFRHITGTRVRRRLFRICDREKTHVLCLKLKVSNCFLFDESIKEIRMTSEEARREALRLEQLCMTYKGLQREEEDFYVSLAPNFRVPPQDNVE